jgi:hypothetical protein
MPGPTGQTGQTKTSGAIGSSGQPFPAGARARTPMPGPASMTRAGISTSPESTGTSRPSPTTGPTSRGGATQGGATALRSGSGSMDPLPGTAEAPHRADTRSRRHGRDRLVATDTTVDRHGTATMHRPRKASPARRPAGPPMTTRRTRPRCGAPAVAADVTHGRYSLASRRRPDREDSRQPTSGALLRLTQAELAAHGHGLARRRRGPPCFRPCRRRPADPVQAYPAQSSLAGIAPPGSSLTEGGPALPAPVLFPRRPAGEGLLVLARCRPVLRRLVRPSPVPGGPRRQRSGSRRRSSGPAESWPLAPSARG